MCMFDRVSLFNSVLQLQSCCVEVYPKAQIFPLHMATLLNPSELALLSNQSSEATSGNASAEYVSFPLTAEVKQTHCPPGKPLAARR